MSISRLEVIKVAKLARLGIPEATLETYSHSLSSILNLVDQLNAIDTQGIAPMSSPLDAVQRLRDDAVTESNHREAYQAVAPAVEQGLYLVPKVIE